MRKLLTLAAAMLFVATAAFADPAGTYRVEGTNPGGGGAYRGTVSVTKTGETYQVVWEIQGQRYVGTGIGNKDFLSVSYKSGDQTGLALYGEEAGGWAGIWTYQGGRSVGAERWRRQ